MGLCGGLIRFLSISELHVIVNTRVTGYYQLCCTRVRCCYEGVARVVSPLKGDKKIKVLFFRIIMIMISYISILVHFMS